MSHSIYAGSPFVTYNLLLAYEISVVLWLVKHHHSSRWLFKSTEKHITNVLENSELFNCEFPLCRGEHHKWATTIVQWVCCVRSALHKSCVVWVFGYCALGLIERWMQTFHGTKTRYAEAAVYVYNAWCSAIQININYHMMMCRSLLMPNNKRKTIYHDTLW